MTDASMGFLIIPQIGAMSVTGQGGITLMSKWTPGPWIMTYSGHGKQAVPAEVRAKHLRIVIDHGENFGDPLPDARLIAAAPGIAKEARKLVEAMRGQDEFDTSALEAELDKAEGA